MNQDKKCILYMIELNKFKKLISLVGTEMKMEERIKMKDKITSKTNSKYFILVIGFLLLVNLSLGYLLMSQSKSAMITLMQTRMLDVSNTAAAMVDGDILQDVTPEDEGTEGYNSIMRTLTYFQDSIDLKYIYCIRDMGDGTFTFGLDPTVEDPGEFGSPIVYTDALYSASKGKSAADDKYYEDAWGKFYSAYSPVFNSKGDVAGIIAVDFSAEWYDRQLLNLTRTIMIVSLLSLLIGGSIAITIITKSERRIGSIHGQLNDMANTLMQEMGNAPETDEMEHSAHDHSDESFSMDDIEKQIQSMQSELKTQIAHVHVQAFQDGLTGVKSKHAYLEVESVLDEKISEGSLRELAIVVCDVNGLKVINDTLGHKAGDEYIRKACRMICDIFAHSPVYRVGGDEFVVVLTGRDYENRRALMYKLHKRSSSNIMTNDAIVSGGLAEYEPGRDHCIHEVFERADSTMYKEKELLKSLGAVTRADESMQSDSDVDFEKLIALNERKHILIADDIESNRELLGDLLQDDYDILYAADGLETMEMLRRHRNHIALLLLDLYMPNMSGREVLTEMQVDEDLMSIPVVVLTIDQDAELDSLKIGAMDFIPKPYPDIDIIKARIAKCIELSENRDLIRYTQNDKLTGLLNYEYFIRYVDRYDQQHEGRALDAVVCDINQFYVVNEQHGRQFGDLVLRSIGSSFRKLARRTGGICCRKGGDTFLLYCPHREDYEQVFRKFLSTVFIEKETVDKVELRFGAFTDAQQEPDIEEWFVYAKLAADSIENDPQKICGFYQIQNRI